MSQLLVQLIHLFKSFRSISLFEDLSLSIHQGDVFALIGDNGAGKTTLLKLLTKAIAPDQGELSMAPNLTIGFLPQEVMIPDSITTARQFLKEDPCFELEKHMAVALEKDQLTEWAELHETYEQLGGYKRVPVEKVLAGLKLETSLLDLPLACLSSGQRVRLALARALTENPDLLLLDEPTNHLDAETLEWLKHILIARSGATVIVSHDRKFINATCNQVIELKGGRLNSYGGNYDFYLAEQERCIEGRIKAYDAQEEERALLKQKIKAFIFSKGKPSLPADRNTMAYNYRGGNHQKSEDRRLDALKARLLEIEENPIQQPRTKSITGLKFVSTPLLSTVAIELEEITKAFGSKVLFSYFSKCLFKGDRVVLTGPNGAGKTTLLECIAGKISVDSGQIHTAPTAKIAYCAQEIDELPMDQTPLEYFKNRFQQSEEAVRRELHKAALGGADLIRLPFASLSVGQRKRLMLLSMILEKPNVLLLDEPTNHLDFLTLEALETALLNFEGAILAVSHDSTFIEKIATKEWKLWSIGF